MRITSLSLNDFRNHAHLNLDFTPGTTTIIGRNGLGKTNIVEAVNYLATLGSHRVSQDIPMIRSGLTQANIAAQISKHDRSASIDITINSVGSNQVLLNGSQLTRPRDLLGLVHTIIFAPEDLELVKGDPSSRRKYVDDFSVQLTPRFAGVKQEFERVLKQRNSLLKSNGRRGLSVEAKNTLETWNELYVSAAADVVEQRLAALQLLTELITEHGQMLSGNTEPLRVDYSSTWLLPESNSREEIVKNLTDELARRLNDEVERAMTLVGPHRDDLKVTLSDMPAKGYASHGQSWSIALAMRLATFDVLRQHDDDPILILDDVFAELDEKRRTRLAGAVGGVEQTLITAAVQADVPGDLDAAVLLLENVSHGA